MGLHLAILAAANRGHRKRHGNSRSMKRLRPVRPNHKAELRYRAGLLQLVARCRSVVGESLHALQSHWPRPTSADGQRVGDAIPYSVDSFIRTAKAKLGNLDQWTKRMVGLAVEANRDSVDDRLTVAIKNAIGVDVGHLLHANGPLLSAMKDATTDNIALITSIPEKYFGRVEQTLTDGWTSGLRWESMVDQIADDGRITENRAKLIARDQTAKMNSAFNQERQQQVGIEKYEWSTSEDERVRDSHAELDGQIFSWDDPPIVDGEKVNPGEAIQCFPGETVFSPSARVLKAYRRAYGGELTTIITESGEAISSTPNHPVLTRRGWVPIQFVDIGEDVFQAPLERGEFFVGNPQSVKTTALEFFSALSALGVPHRVSGATSWFHGDGTDEQIDIVDVDWSLGDKLDPALSKEFCQNILSRSDEPGLGLGTFAQLFGASGLASDSIMRGACKGLSSLWAGLSHSGEHALAAIARLDTLALEIVGDRFALDSKVFRELLHAHSTVEERNGFVMRVLFGVMCRAIDPVNFEALAPQPDAEAIGVHVQEPGDVCKAFPLLQKPTRVIEKFVSENTSGHVFNLQTVTGWYVAQGLFVRNCRCVAIPYVDMGDAALGFETAQPDEEQEAA